LEEAPTALRPLAMHHLTLKRWGAVPLKRWGAVPLKRWGAVPLMRWGAVPLKRWGAVPLKRWGAVRPPDNLCQFSAHPQSASWGCDPLTVRLGVVAVHCSRVTVHHFTTAGGSCFGLSRTRTMQPPGKLCTYCRGTLLLLWYFAVNDKHNLKELSGSDSCSGGAEV
jgi:hypothetical protein